MRIRTVKPEFFQSEKLARTTRDARLLLVGLLLCADDVGRFRAHPALLRGELFPYEADVDAASIERWLAELAGIGVVRLYEVGGARYGVVVNFTEHQKIDKRWQSRLPAPPAEPPPSSPPGRRAAASAPPADRGASRAEERAGLADQQANRTEEPASLARESASLANGSARNGHNPGSPRLAEESASLAGPRAGLAIFPLWNGMEHGEEPLVRVPTVVPTTGPEGPVQTSKPDQKPEPATAPAVVELHRALLFSGYRSGLKPPDRVRMLLAKAAELDALGMTPAELGELVALDRAKANTPGALLATWLDRGAWRDVLGEQRMKANERGARARGAAANAAAEAGAELAAPMPVADVVAAVVANARPA